MTGPIGGGYFTHRRCPKTTPNATPKIGFDKNTYVTGGKTSDDKGGPVFLIDDRWVIRKPAHMGYGLNSDVERRAYLPQWFQHEFFHHQYSICPEFKLEDESHKWFDRTKWPTDFKGEFEADYYEESFHKRLQTANPPLWDRLAGNVNPEVLKNLKTEDVLAVTLWKNRKMAGTAGKSFNVTEHTIGRMRPMSNGKLRHSPPKGYCETIAPRDTPGSISLSK